MKSTKNIKLKPPSLFHHNNICINNMKLFLLCTISTLFLSHNLNSSYSTHRLLFVHSFSIKSKSNHLPSRNNTNKKNYGIAYAKPKRLEENVDGVLYVNDHCINCAACSFFAPSTFQRSSSSNHHIVYQQPPLQTHSTEFQNARTALAACPVSAIRIDNRSTLSSSSSSSPSKTDFSLEYMKAFSINDQVHNNDKNTATFPHPFPKQLSSNVWLLGHHSSKTFGAFPYFVQGYDSNHRWITIMVDVPKCTPSSIRAVLQLLSKSKQQIHHNNPTPPENNNNNDDCNNADNHDDSSSSSSILHPDYLFLTHVDDTAHHNEWKKVFPKMKRIFHSGDLGPYNWIGDETLNQVEILLQPQKNENDHVLEAFTLEGEPVKLRNNFNEKMDESNYYKDLSHLVDMMIDTTNHNGNDNNSSVFQGEFLILHTPGHSPGSISLLYYPWCNDLQRSQNSSISDNNNSNSDAKEDRCVGTIFTGDTLSYTTRDGGHMTGFPRYGNDLREQANTLLKLKQICNMWDCVASGHGHIRHYYDDSKSISDDEKLGDERMAMNIQKRRDIDIAVKELLNYRF